MTAYKDTRGRYLVDFKFTYPDGRKERFRLASPVQTKAGAEQYERDVRRELQAGTYKQRKGEVPTLEKFAPDYIAAARANLQKHSTITSKQQIVDTHLVPHLGGKRLDEIGSREINAFRAKLEHLAPKTINNVCTVLDGVLKLAVSYKVIASAPAVPLVKVDEGKEMAFYEPEVYERLVDAAARAGPEVLALTLLLGDAGLRAGEAQALRWTDVDFKRGENGSLNVSRAIWRGVESTTKGHETRRVPMTSRLAEALRAVRRVGGERVFFRLGAGDVEQPITIGIVGYLVSKAERRAGGIPIKGRAHVLRHTFGSRLAAAGAPALTIQKLMGHKRLETSLRYLHLFEKSREDAIASLEKPLPAGQQHGSKG